MLVRRAIPLAALIGFSVGAVAWLWVRTAPLDAIVHGGAGPPTVVLLHGYGAQAQNWLQFVDDLRVPPTARLVFPHAPLRGPGRGRGWWWLNIRGHIPPGQDMADFSTANPAGIKVAAELVRNYLSEIKGPIVLGGFSQGAMLSGEIAFQSDHDLAALILLGGTTVNEAAWVERFPQRRDLPIFIAHGRQDGVLPFSIAERFANKLRAAGMKVTWFPFDGGHDIPAPVIAELNAFLANLTLQ